MIIIVVIKIMVIIVVIIKIKFMMKVIAKIKTMLKVIIIKIMIIIKIDYFN